MPLEVNNGAPHRGTPGYVLPTLLDRPIASEDADTWGALLVLFDLLSDIPAGELLCEQFDSLSEADRALAEEQLPPTRCSDPEVFMSAQALGMLTMKGVRLVDLLLCALRSHQKSGCHLCCSALWQHMRLVRFTMHGCNFQAHTTCV